MEMKDLNIRRIFWAEIKNEIKQANHEFYSLVEEINPGEEYPLYLLQFPYGDLIGDNISQFIPLKNGDYIRLNDPNLPSEILKDLGYGKSNSPMGIILDKHFELFVDLKSKNTILPFRVQKPGDFLNYTRILNISHDFNYAPNGVLSMTSGTRSSFVLPSIGCSIKFSKMCRSLKLQLPKPDSIYNHHALFKSLLNSPTIMNNWCSSLIYFSEIWINNIKNHADWHKIQKYFFKLFSQKSQYPNNLIHYNTAYSLLLEKNNLKPNPYLFDTFKHLINIMLGEVPGFSPAVTENDLPLGILQQIFVSSYGFVNTIPTIMTPSTFEIRQKNSEPIYYSLQIPTTSSFSPKSKNSSVMVDLRELQYLYTKLKHELIKDNDFCSNTIIQYAFQNLELSFYHNYKDIDCVIDQAKNLTSADDRYNFITDNTQNTHMQVADDAKFFRGCVKISWGRN